MNHNLYAAIEACPLSTVLSLAVFDDAPLPVLASYPSHNHNERTCAPPPRSAVILKRAS